ncbi:MAG: ABC transporter permease [Kiritimatiellia bacterium]
MPGFEEIVIEPGGKWVRIPWREVLRYKDLLFLLVRRDFVSKYKQTVLGPLWFIIQPILMTLVFTVIFGKVAKIPTDKLPPMLFYLCGMLGWRYFSMCLGGTSSTFVSNARLFGKVYFPRLVVPLSVVISNLLAFAIQFGTFIAFWVFFKYFTSAGARFHLTSYVFLLPLLLIQSAAIGLGVGLWMSALTAKYRDFAHLSGFLTQIWMYATPVVYPLSEVIKFLENKEWEQWSWLPAVNPMTGIIECYRMAFLGKGTVEPMYLLVSAAMTVVLLFSGILIFSRSERTFIDTV